jgi:hypothetical protein
MKLFQELPGVLFIIFKECFHGVLPSGVRNGIVQLKSCPKLSFQITIKGEKHMNYQIEQCLHLE